MPESVADRVKRVTVKVLKVDPASIKPESRFAADLGAESIQSVELMAEFEEEFDIAMNEDEALAVKTFGGAVEFIEKCLKEQHEG